ncbi:BNR domain-containing protein [Pseudomonas taiwanensis]|uniref:WD40/YVTN/BNR-like repeat-containing protein n=1 Tax=Pseudomonas taiwanensis TaxID=470150 RepID=UPI0015B894F0|nr:YCF48-related protein [Pseudomonas taiwanensis]NWL77752.1 BNR domain-containing protein [Pseudomonas taiwanensis]
MNRLRPVSGLLLALALSIATPCLADAKAVGDVLESPAMQVPNAERAVFTDLTRAGDRLVAVGERGLVLLSDDNGQHWRQAQVPVSVGLTAVQFVDASHGWAVGHAGVVLATTDGGENWALQLDGRRAAQLELDAARHELPAAADAEAAETRVQTAERLVEEGADKPLLALAFSDADHGLVVGAYGLALRTEDGGTTWRSVMGTIDNPMGLHLYAVARQGVAWFLAGEQGYLARSPDGQQFQQLESPYAGTLFTLASRADGALLIGGLKGHAFLLAKDADSAEALPMMAPLSFSDAICLDDGRVLLANQAGGLFVSASGALIPAARPLGKPVSGLVQAADGSLVLAGFTGLLRLPQSAVSASE